MHVGGTPDHSPGVTPPTGSHSLSLGAIFSISYPGTHSYIAERRVEPENRLMVTVVKGGSSWVKSGHMITAAGELAKEGRDT